MPILDHVIHRLRAHKMTEIPQELLHWKWKIYSTIDPTEALLSEITSRHGPCILTLWAKELLLRWIFSDAFPQKNSSSSFPNNSDLISARYTPGIDSFLFMRLALWLLSILSWNRSGSLGHLKIWSVHSSQCHYYCEPSAYCLIPQFQSLRSQQPRDFVILICRLRPPRIFDPRPDSLTSSTLTKCAQARIQKSHFEIIDMGKDNVQPYLKNR